MAEAGTYQVYAWWTHHDNRSASVPYRVTHASGTATVTVNQHDAGLAGRWNLLGTYSFAAGGAGCVEVSGENGQACADAIRLVPSAGTPGIAQQPGTSGTTRRS